MTRRDCTCLMSVAMITLLTLLPELVHCHPALPKDNCHARFVEYHPSTLEQKWLDNVAEWQNEVCENTPDSDILPWLKITEDYNNHIAAKFVETNDQAVTRQQLPWGEVLSTFTYRRTCPPPPNSQGQNPTVTFVHIPIEPTASLCRDPRKCWSQMTEKYTQSKEYLIALSAEAFQKIPPLGDATAKSFLFDAGATMPVKNAAHVFNWSGTDWIYTFYKNLGVTFDSVYAWEPPRGWRPPKKAKAVGQQKLKSQGKRINSARQLQPRGGRQRVVNNRVKKEMNFSFFPEGVLNFRNVGISTELGDRENPLEEIKRLCKPEDFVVFKLDVDSAFEIEVVRTLLGDPELLALVDDFYYEHHVRNYAMRMHGLGNLSAAATDPLYTLKGWYDLVTPARRGGLRMHFWP